MNRNKKIVALVLVVCFSISLLATLAACNKDEEPYVRKQICDMLTTDTEYTVVLPANYTTTQQYAAEQICYYYSQVTGEEITYVTDSGLVLSDESTYFTHLLSERTETLI